jgi:2-deoxy-D-gluconate 3-dehydrogenase
MILDKFRLDGKVAVVTGAARGLGQGMALGLAEAGADIVLVDLLDLTDSRSRVEALGRRCTAVTADLSHEESVARIVSAAQSSMGSIEIKYSGRVPVVFAIRFA